MSWPERGYRALLLVYPKEFRCEYAAEMKRVFRDRWRDESRLSLVFELVTDIVLSPAMACRKRHRV